jgi:hypothetical protein
MVGALQVVPIDDVILYVIMRDSGHNGGLA